MTGLSFLIFPSSLYENLITGTRIYILSGFLIFFHGFKLNGNGQGDKTAALRMKCTHEIYEIYETYFLP